MSKGTDALQQTWCTGRLLEIKNFSSINYSNSSSLDKSFSINLKNPGNFMTTSVVGRRGMTKAAPSEADVSHNSKYASDLYQPGARSFKPFDSGSDNPNSKYEGVALHGEMAYGIDASASDLATFDIGEPYVLGEMQRIWVIFKTEFTDGTETKYVLVGGIITGFGEGYDYSGNTSFVINCAGVGRLLDLTRIHTKQYYGAFFKTQSEYFAEKILFPLMDGMTQTAGFMAQHGPIGTMLYAVWVTNALFSWFGRKCDYQGNHLTDSAQTGNGNYTGMFYQLPLWKMPDKVAPAPSAMQSALQDLSGVGAEVLGTTEARNWFEFLTKMFDKDISYNYLQPRSKLYDHHRMRAPKIKALYESGVGGGESVTVADLLPEVYYDDLIYKLYSGDTGPIQLFEKKIAATFELYAMSSMTAKEMLDKMAQAAMAVIREDDAGNIIFELSRYWEAPALTETEANHVTVKEYSDWFLKNTDPNADSPFITRQPDTNDYILDGRNFKGWDSSVSEANVVTHVEIPVQPQYMEQSEIINNLSATGYSGQGGADKERKSYIEMMERRYGYRAFTGQQLHSNGYSFRDDRGNVVRLKAAMNIFADALMDFRNYSRMQCTIRSVYAPWLDCNRNVMLMDRGELWMITDKTISYMRGETSGEATISLSCSHGHYLTEKVGYPFLDALIHAGDVEADIQAIDAAISAAAIDESLTTTAAPTDIANTDAYDNIIKSAADYFGLPWDLPKALFLHESEMNPNAESDTGAKGIAQIFAPAAQDVKNKWPETAGLDLNVPEDNIWLGVGYLKICLGDCDNNVYFGLFGYNRGRGTARSAYKSAASTYGRPPSKAESYVWLKKYPPDQYGNPAGDAYVAKVEQNFKCISNPQRDIWGATSATGSMWPDDVEAAPKPWEEG